jgi:hypothetical protein
MRARLTLAALRRRYSDRIAELWQEETGYWARLNPGWLSDEGTTHVHGESLGELDRLLSLVEREGVDEGRPSRGAKNQHMTLYHGTAAKNAFDIEWKGLRPGPDGDVWLTDDPDLAFSFWHNGDEGAIVTVRVHRGDLTKIDDPRYNYYTTDFVPPEAILKIEKPERWKSPAEVLYVKPANELAEGCPSRGTLWTIDYRAVWPDGRGLWRIAVVRAMSAAEALAKLRAHERGVEVTQVTVDVGDRVPGYPANRIVHDYEEPHDAIDHAATMGATHYGEDAHGGLYVYYPIKGGDEYYRHRIYWRRDKWHEGEPVFVQHLPDRAIPIRGASEVGEAAPTGARLGWERRRERDERVVQNLDPVLLPLWERTKGMFRGTPHERYEQFMQYVHDHPSEVVKASQDAADAWLDAQLQRQGWASEMYGDGRLAWRIHAHDRARGYFYIVIGAPSAESAVRKLCSMPAYEDVRVLDVRRATQDELTSAGMVSEAARRSPPPTPTLDRLKAEGLVWVENGEYVGRAADGAIVSVGSIHDEVGTERYLRAHPSPEQW